MNRAHAQAWDTVEKVATTADPDGARLVRDGHRFWYQFQLDAPDDRPVAPEADCRLWAEADSPRYCLMVNGVSVRLHASELVLPVATAIAESGIRPSWATEEEQS